MTFPFRVINGKALATSIYFRHRPLARLLFGEIAAVASSIPRKAASRVNQKNVQVIPADNKLGFPPAALNRSYSARTAHEPTLY
jgi:hypothetical protein